MSSITVIAEYELFIETEARRLFAAMTEEKQHVVRQQTKGALNKQERFGRLTSEQQACEIDRAITMRLAGETLPPFEKWCVRRAAKQAMLPFFTGVAELS